MADPRGPGRADPPESLSLHTATQAPVWTVRNKVDLLDSSSQPKNESIQYNELGSAFSVSALEGAGVAALLAALETHVSGFFGSESGLLTRERHRYALKEAESALTRALAENPSREDIVAEELRLAARALGRLTGRVDVEDILDVIFRDFCIGK
jgi:tRNA modification GTPase